MSEHDAALTVPESSVWAGWPRAAAAAWADAMLAYDEFRPESEVTPMLHLALWHGFHLHGVLPELRAWAAEAGRFEAAGVTADAFVRFHEAAGVPRWSPAADRRCRSLREQRGAAPDRSGAPSASATVRSTSAALRSTTAALRSTAAPVRGTAAAVPRRQPQLA